MWKSDAKDLAAREQSRVEGARHIIGEHTRQRIRVRYAGIVLEGLALNPEPLIRLEERYEEIMGFFEYPGVPFDNN